MNETAGDLLGIGLSIGFFVWLFWAFTYTRLKRIGSAGDTPDRPDLPYTVFTREFDREVQARDAAIVLQSGGARLGLPSDVTHPLPQHRAEMARESHAAALQSSAIANIRRFAESHTSGTAIGLLLDQSGSMVNSSPTIAGEIRALSDVFDTAGMEFSVFGFTTVGWHGGLARKAWLGSGSPTYPGRLCSLLHLIYKEGAEQLADDNWQVMLSPGSYFENVDGEAVQWAAAKLELSAKPNRILIVVSDGAPVDDLTLQANGAGILDRHLREVISGLPRSLSVRLGAIGLGFDVGRYYPVAEQTKADDGFLDAFERMLHRLMSGSGEPGIDAPE